MVAPAIPPMASRSGPMSHAVDWTQTVRGARFPGVRSIPRRATAVTDASQQQWNGSFWAEQERLCNVQRPPPFRAVDQYGLRVAKRPPRGPFLDTSGPL